MPLKEKIERLVNEYLREPEKRKLHHIDISIPWHDGRFWIIDAFSLGASTDKDPFKLAIYFSVDQLSNKGKRVVQAIDVLDIFEGYQEGKERQYLTFYTVTDNNSSSIAREIENIISSLFPVLDSNEIKVDVKRLEN